MSVTPMETASPNRIAAKQAECIINDLIRSGQYKPLLDALKGFRNGFVYGARIRAPHALVLNLVWSSAPYRVMAKRIYEATKRHSIALGLTSFTFALVRAVLRFIQGESHPWHAALGGFIVGYLYWGEQNPVTVQMSMYILSRIISAGLFVLANKYKLNIPQGSFRIYHAVLWMIVMPLFFYHGDSMQSTMRTSMKYIYQDNEKYTSWYDLICVNSATSF